MPLPTTIDSLESLADDVLANAERAAEGTSITPEVLARERDLLSESPTHRSLIDVEPVDWPALLDIRDLRQLRSAEDYMEMTSPLLRSPAVKKHTVKARKALRACLEF